MHQSVVVIVAALVGGIVGAVVVAALSEPPSPVAERRSDGQLTAAVTELRDAVRDLSRTAREPRSGRHPATGVVPERKSQPDDPPETAPPPAAEPAVAASPGSATVPDTPLVRARGSVLPEKNRERLLELKGWQRDVQVRRAWMLVSDRDMLAWGGVPDSITINSGTEAWHYEWRDEFDNRVRIQLQFHDRRLIQVF